jgi:hypothetical protein
MWKPDHQDCVVEHRKCRRFNIPLNGRLMLTDRAEFQCHVIDVSSRNVFLKTDADGRRGERIIAYIDHIGRIEGRIVRITQYGFAMELDLHESKQDRLSVQLRKLANAFEKQSAEARRLDHERGHAISA